MIIQQIARDDANLSKGYGFVSFSNFEASDDAIANMNGQYLMNKEVSVQYAYKKDGKGERHGDEAERMLAAQARKHNVQPQTQPLPPQLVSGGAPMAPAAMVDGDATRPMDGGPPGFGAGRGSMANGGYSNMPPHHQQPPQQQQHHHHQQQQQQQQQQQRQFPQQHQLATPPPGLPARPPPSQAGYGGPQAFVPPGFSGQQPQSGGFAPGGPPPGAPPPGAVPPGAPPQGIPPPGFSSPAGFAPPAGGPGAPGAPPQLPPGFQQAGYGRGR